MDYRGLTIKINPEINNLEETIETAKALVSTLELAGELAEKLSNQNIEVSFNLNSSNVKQSESIYEEMKCLLCVSAEELMKGMKKSNKEHFPTVLSHLAESAARVASVAEDYC